MSWLLVVLVSGLELGSVKVLGQGKFSVRVGLSVSLGLGLRL